MIAAAPTDPTRRIRRTEPQPHPAARRRRRRSPRSLPALREALERCRDCPIGEHATQAVAGEGPLHARADVRRRAARRPGGPAGPALRRPGRPAARPRPGASSASPRDAVYVTNAVKHFKFELRGKRRIHKTPAQQEAAACLHWLESEIALVAARARWSRSARRPRAPAAGPAVAVTRERGTLARRAATAAGC